jgi:hypothetical protein
MAEFMDFTFLAVMAFLLIIRAISIHRGESMKSIKGKHLGIIHNNLQRSDDLDHSSSASNLTTGSSYSFLDDNIRHPGLDMNDLITNPIHSSLPQNIYYDHHSGFSSESMWNDSSSSSFSDSAHDNFNNTMSLNNDY